MYNCRAILQSKTSWYEHSEKSSKCFLSLNEKRNKAKSHLWKVTADSNTEISDPSAIMRHAKHFYSSLYNRCSAKNEKECLEYLNGFSLPKLKSTEQEVCEGILTKKECWHALKVAVGPKPSTNRNLKEIITIECTKIVIFQLLRPLGISKLAKRELIQ